MCRIEMESFFESGAWELIYVTFIALTGVAINIINIFVDIL